MCYYLNAQFQGQRVKQDSVPRACCLRYQHADGNMHVEPSGDDGKQTKYTAAVISNKPTHPGDEASYLGRANFCKTDSSRSDTKM